VIQVTKLKAPHLKKSRSSISIKSNIEWWNKKKSIIQKDKKIIIKRMRIKCEIKINEGTTYDLELKSEIEEKIKFTKESKNKIKKSKNYI